MCASTLVYDSADVPSAKYTHKSSNAYTKCQEAPTEEQVSKSCLDLIVDYINCTIKGYSGEILVTKVAAPCVLDAGICS